MPRKTGLFPTEVRDRLRLQFSLFATLLKNRIAPDNPVRVVDAFVDSLALEALGFRAVRPPFRGA